ncbi:helix-turn-helix transcriptional regulator [Hyalangium rubrum]|uniref:Response regulator transcription factor n=1 Tax=Hyalangium rubrum TaxID=3103134 RepID=A0ABU5HIJ1_9BACT|nr:response regulator transcription factor [Hyalangium sp. s54d21]MDY7232632.1 response regulator transcription factor [Hyalangium sp. s54d21]
MSDRKPFREGIVRFLQSQGLQHITEYDSGAELVRDLRSVVTRLVLIDMEHRSEAPFSLLLEVRRHAPGCTAMILGATLPSAAANSDGDAATPERGVLGVDPQMLMAVAQLAQANAEPGTLQAQEPQRQRWSTLTPRQREVLGYLSTGSDNLKIAAHLGISERAVKAHVSALLSLFSAENRTELAVLACRAGMRPPHRSQPTPPPLPQPRLA